MNRRAAMMLTMLLGGLAPRSLLAQEPRRTRRPSSSGRALRPASSVFDEEDVDGSSTRLDADDPPAGLMKEPGFQLRTYKISDYTRIADGNSDRKESPQKSIIEWIFRRTGTAVWHGDKVAVLCASKSELRAYNSPEILKQVDEVVERFTHASEDLLRVRVQFYATADTRWRHAVYAQLTPVASGPQGQQIWTMRMADAIMMITQLQAQQGLRKLADEQLEMVNGQVLTIRTAEPRTYAGGMQRESAAGQGYTPRTDKLEESIILKFSPLLTFDTDEVDASIDLTINTIQNFHRTKVITPREQGAPEMSIDVPQVSMSRLDQTIKNWPLGQTLLISGGIHPGVLDKKSGWFGTPLGAPGASEVLVFLDVETVGRSRSKTSGADARTNRSRTRPLEQDDFEDEEPIDDPPPVQNRKSRGATRGPDLGSEIDLNDEY